MRDQDPHPSKTKDKNFGSVYFNIFILRLQTGKQNILLEGSSYSLNLICSEFLHAGCLVMLLPF